MSLLERIRRGKRIAPRRVLLYSMHGLGKSTWASMSNKPVFIRTEDGLNDIECDSLPLEDGKCESFSEVMNYFAMLYQEPHDFQTIVIDTLDWLERLVWDNCCKRFSVNNIELVDKGYGKGYTHCLHEWREIIAALDALRNDRGMMVILLAHAKIEKFENPETDSYDRYVPRINKHASYLIQEWCDEVLFGTKKVYTSKSDEGFNKTRTQGIGTDERVIRTTERPAHAAKSRLPGLPYELPLDWREFAKYLPGATAA